MKYFFVFFEDDIYQPTNKMDEVQLKKIISTLIDGLREEKIADKELNNAVGAAGAALTYQLVPQTIINRYENAAEVIKKAEDDEKGDAPPQYDVADGVSPIFNTLEKATDYCSHINLPLTLIRRYEQYENEDEEEDWCPEWNYDDWTHPFGNPTEEDEQKATRYSNLHNGDI